MKVVEKAPPKKGVRTESILYPVPTTAIHRAASPKI